jgi:hypothetical protein
MERADNAAFNHRPEAINGIGMNRPDNIFAPGMVNHAMIVNVIKKTVPGVIISRKQADFLGNRLPHELIQGRSVNMVNNLGDNLTTSSYGSNNGGLAGRPTSPAAPLIPVLIFGLAADKGFINLDKSNELAEFIIAKPFADSVTHIPGRAIRPCADHPVNLQGANALFTAQHKVDYFKPGLQGIIGVLENRSYQDGETVSAPSRAAALPVKGAAQFIDLITIAAWTPYPFRPAPGSQISLASVLSRESGFQFGQGHLIGFWNFHGLSPSNLDDSKDSTYFPLCQEVDNRLWKRGTFGSAF